VKKSGGLNPPEKEERIGMYAESTTNIEAAYQAGQ